MNSRSSAAKASNPAQAAPFRVAQVIKTGSPDGGEEGGWYRYVLDNGRSTITGQRQGSLKEVTAHAAHCAEQINARGSGRQSHWAPRGRKPAAAKNAANSDNSGA